MKDVVETQYYVYELIDPRNGEVFYVGKGSGSRMYHHKRQAFQLKGAKINPHRSARICQIINEGYEIVYKKRKCKTEKEAFSLEQNLIKQYGKRCDKTGGLTNLTDGGEGYSGGHIPVCQYDLFGNFIRRHRSAKDAAIFLGKRYYSQITTACRGGRRGEVAAFGFLWAYENKLPQMRTKIISVYQWSDNGDMIQRFPSVADASKHLECDPSNIPRAIKRRWFSSGFIWSYDPTFPGNPLNKRKRKVLHKNTGKVYNTISEAAKHTAHSIQSVCAVCKGKRVQVGGDYFCYADSDQC